MMIAVLIFMSLWCVIWFMVARETLKDNNRLYKSLYFAQKKLSADKCDRCGGHPVQKMALCQDHYDELLGNSDADQAYNT